jgi:hypothetical protein
MLRKDVLHDVTFRGTGEGEMGGTRSANGDQVSAGTP